MSDLVKIKPWLVNEKENDNQYLEYIVPSPVSNNSLGKASVLYEKEFVFDLKGDTDITMREEVERWDKMFQDNGYYKLSASAYDGIEYKKDDYSSGLIILSDENNYFHIKARGNGSLIDSMYDTSAMTEMGFNTLVSTSNTMTRFPLDFKQLANAYDKNKTIIKQNIMAFVTEYGSLDKDLIPSFMMTKSVLSMYDPKDKTESDRFMTDKLNNVLYQKNVQIAVNQLINGKYLEVAHNNRIQLGEKQYPFVKSYLYVKPDWELKKIEKAVQYNVLLYLKNKCAVNGKEIITVSRNELLDGPLEKYHLCANNTQSNVYDSRVLVDSVLSKMCQKEILAENKKVNSNIITLTYNARSMANTKQNQGVER